jgi:hypothetical protein
MITKSFIPQGQICLMEFIEDLLEEWKYYRVFPEVSLMRTIQSKLETKVVPSELRAFMKSCSSIDALICRHDSTGSYPYIAIERQSPYHDDPEQQAADRKKAELLAIAEIPLLYAHEPVKGTLKFHWSDQVSPICSINVYRNRGRQEFRDFLLKALNSIHSNQASATPTAVGFRASTQPTK